MASAFEDSTLGLKLKGYSIIPNDILETKIGIYTPEIVETILQEHPEVVDRWLQRLHEEYIANKKSCDFENDPVACFTLSVYEQFERHFKSWEDGGLIPISLPHGRTIRVTKKPLISMVSGPHLVCSKCMTSFSNIEEYEKHLKEEDAKPAGTAKPADTVAPSQVWGQR